MSKSGGIDTGRISEQSNVHKILWILNANFQVNPGRIRGIEVE